MANRINPDVGASNFKLESTTVWSFPERGLWARHSRSYRGNWAPQIPRNVILRYSREGDLVLDPMMGSGTTLVECVITARKGMGYDINPQAVTLAQDNLKYAAVNTSYTPVLKQGDARHLAEIDSNSVDLILTHPPYADIIKYSNIDGDLSRLHDVEAFCKEMNQFAQECFRLLKPGRFCAILMGDTRRKQRYVPLAFRTMEEFLKIGFFLKEDVIKQQHNCSATPFWAEKSKKFNFLLIMHEHLFIFQKPLENNDGAR